MEPGRAPLSLIHGRIRRAETRRFAHAHDQQRPAQALANLHLTLMDKLGVRLESFADSTGTLDAPGDRTLSDL